MAFIFGGDAKSIIRAGARFIGSPVVVPFTDTLRFRYIVTIVADSRSSIVTLVMHVLCLCSGHRDLGLHGAFSAVILNLFVVSSCNITLAKLFT